MRVEGLGTSRGTVVMVQVVSLDMVSFIRYLGLWWGSFSRQTCIIRIRIGVIVIIMVILRALRPPCILGGGQR